MAKPGLVYEAGSESVYDDMVELAHEKGPMSPEGLALRRVYDTRPPGRSHEGHVYAQNLSTEDRLALIEFLKSLSGPDMYDQP